jgi:uroporphyrin-3 C-methyltransferase
MEPTVVEEVETPKVLEELSRNNAAAAAGGERQKRRGSGWLVVFFLLLPLLGGAALLGYQQWTLYLRLNLLATENNQLLESLRSSNARIAVLEASEQQASPAPVIQQAEVAELRQQFTARLEQLDQVINQLSQRISSSPVEDDSGLYLAEAEHVLRIANRHLLLTEDVTTTIRLFENADQLLQDSGDSRTLQTREVLASELAQLRSVEEVDTEDLYQQITSLRALVGTIDFTNSIGDSYQQRLAQARDSNALASSPQQQRSLLESGLDFFASIFVFRKWEDAPDSVQPGPELFAVQRTIDLMLEQAQLALLTRQPAVYQQNLRQVRELIDRVGAPNEQATTPVLSQIDSLLGEDLVPEFPDVSRSLLMLQQINSRPQENSNPVAQ